MECYDCCKKIENELRYTCTLCKDLFCDKCIKKCSNCDALGCNFCNTNNICNNCICGKCNNIARFKCVLCYIEYCSECINECVKCNCDICPSCSKVCQKCENHACLGRYPSDAIYCFLIHDCQK